MLFTSLATAAILATSVAAAPTKQEQQTVYFRIGGTNYYASANAMRNGTHHSDPIVLAGNTVDYPGKPGSPAYLTAGKSGEQALEFDLCNQKLDKTIPAGTYGAKVPLIGDNHGYAAPVTLIKDYEQKEYGLGERGVLEHKLGAALQSWFECKDTVNGQELHVLKWGVQQSNGEPPVGCQITEVLL